MPLFPQPGDDFIDNDKNDINSYNDFNSNNEFESEWTDNSDNSDNSTTDVKTDLFSHNSWTDNSTVDVDKSRTAQDSFNVTTQMMFDSSTSVGVRQYNQEFGEFNLFGGGFMKAFGGGGGDVWIDNRAAVVDQSVNQSFAIGDVEAERGGEVKFEIEQDFENESVLAAGDDSMAAGDDVSTVHTDFELEIGDISMFNDDIDNTFTNSFNEDVHVTKFDNDMTAIGSFNDNDEFTKIDDSFNDEFSVENEWEWENEGNIFSPGAATTGGEAETEFDD